jgi:hypothetical protein
MVISHQLDVAAEIFRVQQAFLEGPVVEWEDIGRNLAARFLVDVRESPEELGRRLAVEQEEIGVLELESKNSSCVVR